MYKNQKRAVATRFEPCIRDHHRATVGKEFKVRVTITGKLMPACYNDKVSLLKGNCAWLLSKTNFEFVNYLQFA